MGKVLQNKFLLKRFLKNTVCVLLSFINRFIKKDNKRILIYLNTKLSHNLKIFYDYIIESHFNGTYQVIVATEPCMRAKEAPDHVKFVSARRGILYYFVSRYVVYSYGKVPIKAADGQNVFYIGHGASFKSMGLLSGKGNGYEFYFSKATCTSERYRKLYANALGCGEEDIVICGEPVTDVFYSEKKFYDFSKYKKVILWTPTFRQSHAIGYSDVKGSRDLIPFYGSGEYGILNQYMKKYNLLLIIKLHGAQDLDDYVKVEDSHLRIYSEEDFIRQGYELYPLLKESDALIADFSSVFVEYLLLDRPIGFVLNDFDDYRKNRGFLFEEPLDYMPGMRIYKREDFLQYIDSIAHDRDDYREKRVQVKNELHMFQDGNNAKRLAELMGIRFHAEGEDL